MSVKHLLLCVSFALSTTLAAAAESLPWPPTLPNGKTVVTDKSADFLKPVGSLRPGVEIARAVPTIDFLFFPAQTYEGKPWSVWGDGVAKAGKYYASIGDHGSADRQPPGNALVYEYDANTKTLRCLIDVRKVLGLPEGHYVPGKIHGRLDFGSDGWLYFSTHRGGASLDKYHYRGDWVFRCNPETGKSEVVVHAPVSKHCIPASVLDPDRLIFYGGTAAGNEASEKRVVFFAYDVGKKKLLASVPNGCYRYFLLAKSTGRVYYERTDDKGSPTGELMRFDPAKGGDPVKIGTCPGLRAATEETAEGKAYAVSSGQHGKAVLWSLDAKSEKVQVIGPVAVGSQEYITSIDLDPTGHYLYFVPGAHGGSETDGCPVVQYNLRTNKRKVIAFLHPFYNNKYGFTPIGSFSSAVDPQGDKLYVSWHGRRRDKGWDTCGMTAIHIPESERKP